MVAGPQNFKTRAEYRWAKKVWLKQHGGYMWTTLGLALFFGGLTGSTGLVLSLRHGVSYLLKRPRQGGLRARVEDFGQ
jgi:hypothetical protein